MAKRGGGLAGRFRRAVEAQREERQKQVDATRRRREEGDAARKALLQELLDFAQEVGFLQGSRDGGGVTLRYGKRFAHFAPEGQGDAVVVEFDGMGDDVHRIYRQQELGDRWVWSWRRGRRHDLLPFFDQGLEELMVLALGLPRPDDMGGAPEGGGGGRRL